MDSEKLRHLIYGFESVSFLVSRKLSSIINEKNHDELTREQHQTLRYLAHFGPVTVSELAEIFSVKPSAITAQMNRFVEQGYVERIRDENDRRVVYLKLTDHGFEIFEYMNKQIHQVLAPYLQQVPEEEFQKFFETYEKIANIVITNLNKK